MDIMNVYIARNNMQVQFIRFHQKYRLYSGFLFRIDELNAISLTDQTLFLFLPVTSVLLHPSMCEAYCR